VCVFDCRSIPFRERKPHPPKQNKKRLEAVSEIKGLFSKMRTKPEIYKKPQYSFVLSKGAFLFSLNL